MSLTSDLAIGIRFYLKLRALKAYDEVAGLLAPYAENLHFKGEFRVMTEPGYAVTHGEFEGIVPSMEALHGLQKMVASLNTATLIVTLTHGGHGGLPTRVVFHDFDKLDGWLQQLSGTEMPFELVYRQTIDRLPEEMLSTSIAWFWRHQHRGDHLWLVRWVSKQHTALQARAVPESLWFTGDLLRLREAELLKMPTLGPLRVGIIRETFAKAGYSLGHVGDWVAPAVPAREFW